VFECQQCGDCCQGKGGILVRPEEAEEMAAHLKVSLEEFSRRYLEVFSLGVRLATENGGCVFLGEGNHCRVHPVKPFICRQWPFLPAPALTRIASMRILWRRRGSQLGLNGNLGGRRNGEWLPGPFLHH
jgi:hypothetical protein